MKKPMVKALACALAFTMVATTPLSASASGIAGLYSTGESTTKTATETTTTKTKTLDGKEVEKIEHRDENGNLNSTGTTTITSTVTNGLDFFEGGEEENDKYIIGVHFDKEVIDLEAGEETGITAMVLFSDGTSMTADNFKDLLVFRKIQTKEEGQSLGAGSVTYANYDWTAGGMDILTRDTLKVRGIHGGSFYIEAALKTDKSGEYKYFDVVAVNVKEYAEDITTVAKFEGYAKHTYTLEDLKLTRTPETSNDNITVTAAPSKYVKVNKDNSFTIKREIGDAEVVVTAVSEKGKIAKTTLATLKADPVKKLEVIGNNKNTIGWGTYNNEALKDTWNVEVKVTTVDGDSNTTDKITWTSKNNNVATVAVDENDQTKATITAVGVGKTTVTAKATSGKSVKYTVTVKAPLGKIIAVVDEAGVDDADEVTVDNTTGSIYVGQKLQLYTVVDPKQSKDKVKWMTSNKNVAKVNSKGLVTATTKNKYADEVTITAYTGSKSNPTLKAEYKLTVMESKLLADKLVLDDTYELGKETYKNGVLKSDVVYVTRNEDYNAEASYEGNAALVDSDKEVKDVFETNLLNEMLTWTNSKAKVVTVDDNGFTTADAAGKANLTASVVNANGRTLKAKVTVVSTQAVTSLQTNKTVVNVSPDKNGRIKDVTLKVAKQLPKNATKESLTWELVEGSGSISLKDNNSSFNSAKYVGKTASAKVSFTSAQVGDSATIKVRAANGATSTIVVNVVNPTTKVELRDAADKAVKKVELKVGQKYDYSLFDMATIISGKGTAAVAVPAGTEGYEDVEFSVNKAGIVTIDKDGNVYAVKAGTVKITAKTPAGKKAVMTIKVK